MSSAYLVFMLVGTLVVATSNASAQPEKSSDEDSSQFTIVDSYYDLPQVKTVVKEFRGTSRWILEQFDELGIAVKPLTGKERAHGYGFIGHSLVVRSQLHGTVEAPFSRTKFTLQHPAGIELRFKKLKSFVAMTLSGPTTSTDVGLDMRFLDDNGNLITSINADTKHQNKNELGFDSRGAVFRGLMLETSRIRAVQIVPTSIPDNCKIVLAGIDYLCFSNGESTDKEAATISLAYDEIRSLVEQLDSEIYATRELATQKLYKLEPSYVAFLESMPQRPSMEAKARLAMILRSLRGKGINLTPDGNKE